MKNKDCFTGCLDAKAFTLIELLVVVLIIGILASVALPQYQLAVVKSRLANMISLMTTLKEAEDAYYMSEGSYTDNMDLLPMDLSGCKQIWNDVVQCDNFFMIDPLHNSLGTLRAYYCPDAIKSNGTTVGEYAWYACLGNPEFTYTIWLTHTDNPGLRQCNGITTFGQKVCRSLNL